MEDPNAHDITRLKAAQLALELSNEIYRTSYEGVFQVKDQVSSDMEQWGSKYPLKSYLIQNDITCESLAQYKEAQRQLDKEKEEEQNNKNKRS
jgi:hypothetical protein